MALTIQTATDLRGICGNDRLKKCWKANRTKQKRPQTNGKNHKIDNSVADYVGSNDYPSGVQIE